MATGKTIHREIYDAANRRDLDTLRSLIHQEYTYTGGDGKELAGGPDTCMSIVEMYLAAFPDARVEVRSTYVQGNTAVSEIRMTGTHQGELMKIPPTGKRIDMVACNVVELRDGKVYREREYFDALEMWMQLGVLGPPVPR